MPTYRVRDGHRLAHLGQVLEGGSRVELSPVVAADGAVRDHVEPWPEPEPPARPEPPPKRAAPAAAPAVEKDADRAGPHDKE